MLSKISLFTTLLLAGIWGFLIIKDVGATYLKSKATSQLTLADRIDFNVEIKKVGLKRLDEFAAKSLKVGFLSSESREWVPCNVIHNNKKVPCKIRLRGDLPKHWQGIKRSYRIKFKEPSPFWGWKKVDLILPDDKGMESELAAYQISRELGMISPGAHFSSIAINGIRTGAYFVKQGDSGSLFEMSGRTESMFIRENNIWWFAQNNGGIYKNLMGTNAGDASNLRTLPIMYSPTFEGKAASNLTFSRFADFLHRASEERDISHHLNIKIYYRWMALVMSFGSIHSILPDNLFWYINGSTGLSEPVAYDIIPFKLTGNPFDYFSYKSFLLKQILKQTWSKGGREYFSEALSVIENKIDAIYGNVIAERIQYDSFVRVDDHFSEADAKTRLNNIKSNIRLLKESLP